MPPVPNWAVLDPKTAWLVLASAKRVEASRRALERSEALCGVVQGATITEANRLNDDTTVVAFSDGTSACFTAAELTSLKLERFATVDQDGSREPTSNSPPTGQGSIAALSKA